MALIGVIHGVAEVIERSIIVLIDYIYHQLYERRRLSWGSFRTARRERLATDIAIMSMLCEASAVISVSGFLHLHEYFYTDGKTVPQLLQSFAITSTVPLVIEWFFTCLSIAIETRTRRERLATDIAIMSRRCYLCQRLSSLASIFLHGEQDITGVIAAAVSLVIEWFFTILSIAIETRYQNRPIMAVWRR